MNEQPPEHRPVLPLDPDDTQSLPAEGAAAAQPGAGQPGVPAKQRLRDRLWSFRAVIAVALASVIVGGLGGAALASLSHGGDDGRFGPGHGRFAGRGPGGPGMMNRGPQNRQRLPGRPGTQQRQWRYGDGPGVAPSTPPSPAPSPSQ